MYALFSIVFMLIPIIIVPLVYILIFKYLIRYAIKTYRSENKDYLEYLKTKETSKKE